MRRHRTPDPSGRRPRWTSLWPRVRFVTSWALALGLVGYGLPRAMNVSWDGVLAVLRSVEPSAALVLVALWGLGLIAQSFVLTAAAPDLTHRRALTLNVTGSAVANIVPLGGAAGVELNRRMMRAWGINARAFTGYTFLTNLWDVASKLLLPIVGVIALVRAGEAVSSQLRMISWLAGVGFLGLVALAAMLLTSARFAAGVGRAAERVAGLVLALVGRDREPPAVAAALLEVRRECAGLVSDGWLRMSLGISTYVVLQWLLLGSCLRLTGGGTTWTQALAGFAVERLLTVVPLTPGGIGVADLGLVSVLLALGGDPTGVAAAAVLYRVFVFAIEIPVGGGALGAWLLARRLTPWNRVAQPLLGGDPRRVAHVTDVFLPRLGGIETHVDDLVRHQRATGLDAEVLTPGRRRDDDPAWVRRMSVSRARRAVADYDVVHVHVSVFSPYGSMVARAAAVRGIPTLVTVHSMWSGAGGLLRLTALLGLRRWPVLWSAVSGAAADVFRRTVRGIDVAVLPNAIDVASWRPARPAPRTGSAPITLVSVMRLVPRKRPLQLVRMFERARALAPDADLRLVVVGDGPLRPRLERLVERHGLRPYVRITGRVSRPQVLDELRAASIYVAPAPRESFGIAALEARSAGLPVVASRRSGVGEFIRDRVDGVLVDGDREMTVALADLAFDGRLLGRLGAHNRLVAPRLDWPDVLGRTSALYRAAAQRVGADAAARSDHPVRPVTAGAQ